MIFHPQLPSAVLVTWIQLRCLAWDGWVTPPLSIPELASLIGIHPARLNRHLSQLQGISALSWRAVGHGKIIVAFPEEPFVVPENQTENRNHAGSTFLSSEDQESPPSYFPPQILGYLSIKENQEVSSDIDLIDKNLVDAEAPGARQYEVEKGLLDNRNCDFNPVAKLRNQPSQVNQHGSHAHP
jgi:hypothetical protein